MITSAFGAGGGGGGGAFDRPALTGAAASLTGGVLFAAFPLAAFGAGEAAADFVGTGFAAAVVGAVRRPECSMQATAGTHVVVDVLVFQRREPSAAPGGHAWHDLVEVPVADSDGEPVGDSGGDTDDHAELPDISASPDPPTLPRHLRRGAVSVNEDFVAHPPRDGARQSRAAARHLRRRPLLHCLLQLDAVLSRLPAGVHTPDPDALTNEEPATVEPSIVVGRAADGATVKEGSEGSVLTTDSAAIHKAARTMLRLVLSCRENHTQSGIAARIASDALCANRHLPHMGRSSCPACRGWPSRRRPRVRTSRSVPASRTPVRPWSSRSEGAA